MSDESKATLSLVGRLVRDVGFPVALCLILVFRLSPAVDALRTEVARLTVLIEVSLRVVSK